MKRYSEINRGAITPCDTGDYYRVEDVHALLADCLKPVPVGEHCRWKDITDDQMIIFNEEIFIPAPESYDAINLDGNCRETIPATAIVQPVRLVPAMEVMSDERE